MPRFYLRLVLLPIIIFTAALLLIHAQPSDDYELHGIILSENCPAPCFLGIRPGMTFVDQAMIILSRSNWITDVHWDGDIDTENGAMSNEDGTIFWNWSDQKPDWINAKNFGQIRVEGYKVRTISIITGISGFF